MAGETEDDVDNEAGAQKKNKNKNIPNHKSVKEKKEKKKKDGVKPRHTTTKHYQQPDRW